MNFFITLAIALFIYMTIWFFISIIIKRNDVADIAWGFGFVLIAWLSYFMKAYSFKSLLVDSLVTIWGVRLAWHIYNRNKNKPEDSRYLEWRNTWKNFYIRSFFQVFLLQGLLLFIISLPVIFINNSISNTLGFIDFIGVLVWIFGFYFESVSDIQLNNFLNNPLNKGKLMTMGFWKYSRHPNYFGEVTQWWGIFLLAVSIPGAFYTIIGPLTITFLILFISGIPLLEKKYAGRPDWEAYKQKTSVFFPLFPN